MVISYNRATCKRNVHAFSLFEVVIAMVILAMVLSGLIYGYAQINRTSEWNSLSLVGQAYALQYTEQARAAQWDSQQWPVTNGPGTSDELYPTNGSITYTKMDTNYSATGQSQIITNYVTITDLSTNNVKVRQIQADSVWMFPLSGKLFTSTIVTQRAPDQ